MSKKNQNIHDKKLFIYLCLFCMFWFQMSAADDDSGHNYFQDKDQDGLTDQEELSLGTDPEKEDTDGDGYRDGKEIETGYDPLVPAPGDRIIAQAEEKKGEKIDFSDKGKEEKVNLTNLLVENLERQINNTEESPIYSEEISSQEEDTDSLSSKDLASLEASSLMTGNIDTILNQILNQSNVDIESELKEIPDGEIKIISEIEEEDKEKKKKKEKEQIENYLAATGYVFAVNSPFNPGSEEELLSQANFSINSLGTDLILGNNDSIREIKENGARTIEELKKIETPFILKDFHKRTISLVQFVTDQEEDSLMNQDDPLRMGLTLGKMQAALIEMQTLGDELMVVMDEYNIEGIKTPERLEEDRENQDGEEEDDDNNDDSEKEESEEDEEGEQ